MSLCMKRLFHGTSFLVLFYVKDKFVNLSFILHNNCSSVVFYSNIDITTTTKKSNFF